MKGRKPGPPPELPELPSGEEWICTKDLAMLVGYPWQTIIGWRGGRRPSFQQPKPYRQPGHKGNVAYIKREAIAFAAWERERDAFVWSPD